MSQLLEARRSVRRRVNALPKYDLFLHRFITLVLAANMILILYALISVTFGMTLSGVGFIDSLPLALYILPMMIILPIMIRAYYLGRTAAWNFFFLTICTVFFAMLSFLVHGFIICLIFNISAAVALFIMGRFRPRGKLRQAGKKVIAYFLFVNILGLSFPVSIVLMGQNPIATVPVSGNPEIRLSIPLSDFDYPYQNVTPTPQLLSDIMTNQFHLDFHVQENDTNSWTRLRNWLIAVNDSEIQYSVTLSADRETLAGPNPETLVTTQLLSDVYSLHNAGFAILMSLSLENITNTPEFVTFDMTLSRTEWQQLMQRTRNLDLIGFGELMRRSIYSVNDMSVIENWYANLRQVVDAYGIQAGFLIEPFVIDDYFDGDYNAMKLCGLTPELLRTWDYVSVSCSRSRFSFEMNGDVGEYLVHSYSSSADTLWSDVNLRIGEVGNSTDTLGRTDHVYEDLDVFINDIALIVGNGVNRITVDSLPSFLSAFGNDSLTTLRSAIDNIEYGISTYTFRIYAFRAVFLAIDSFDWIMF
ncbi:MAG: hypothetical protein ACFFFK_04185 [Candidatus Thorarchaeota archaeon]